LWAWAVFISPDQKERGDEQPQFPLGVLLSTLPVHQTTLWIPHQQDTVCGERGKQGSYPVCRHTSSLQENAKCLTVMLISGWGRWIQPFKREDILTSAGSYFSME